MPYYKEIILLTYVSLTTWGKIFRSLKIYIIAIVTKEVCLMQEVIFSKAIVFKFSLSILCLYSPHCLYINLAKLCMYMTVIPHTWKCSAIKSISTFAFSVYLAMNFTLKHVSEALILTQFPNLSHKEIKNLLFSIFVSCSSPLFYIVVIHSVFYLKHC